MLHRKTALVLVAHCKALEARGPIASLNAGRPGPALLLLALEGQASKAVTRPLPAQHQHPDGRRLSHGGSVSFNAADLDSEGIPVLEEPVNQDEGMMMPKDYPIAADDYGVTADEQRVDEPLAERVAREEPESIPGDGPTDADDRVLALVEASDSPAEEDGMAVADTAETGGDESPGSLSPEEAAIHLE